jgi:hypothetical protein
MRSSRRRWLTLSCTLLLVFLAIPPTSGRAGLTDTDIDTSCLTVDTGPELSNSWYQHFHLKDTSDDFYDNTGKNYQGFDRLEIAMTAGFMETPGMKDLSEPMNFEANGYQRVVGTGTDFGINNPFEFNLYFPDFPEAQNVKFTLETWDLSDDGKVYFGDNTAIATWDHLKGKWTVSEDSEVLRPHDKPAVVPLPASVLLGVFAVGLAGRKLRKFI